MDHHASGDQQHSSNQRVPETKTVFGLPFPPEMQDKPKTSSKLPRVSKKKQKPKHSKSVIYGATSHNPNHKLGQFKSPWVPAPGLATSVAHIVNCHLPSNSDRIFSAPDVSSNYFEDESSNFSSLSNVSYKVPSRTKNKSIRNYSSKPKSSSKSKKSQTISKEESAHHRRKSNSSDSNHSLQTHKDSLIDVTAFLESKREEIGHLWQHFINDGDQELLSTFETANRLALDAANEVEKLRISIQDLHEKESSLSDGDCEILSKLRQRVLSKIKEFEEVNNKVQDEVARASERARSTALLKSTSKASSSTSTVKKGHADKNHKEDDELVFIKESKGFQVSNNSSTDSDDDPHKLKIPQEFENQDKPPIKFITATQSRSNITDKTATTSASIDLNKLTRLYDEQYSFPPVVAKNAHTSLLNNQDVRKDQKIRKQKSEESYPRSVHFAERENENEIQILTKQLGQLLTNISTNKESLEKTSTLDDRQNNHSSEQSTSSMYYKGKVHKLQRKLLEAEVEMEELKEDLQRVESESNFQVRLLKSNFEERLDTLENYPEYLQQTEKKLVDILQSKSELEKRAKMKEKEISKLMETNQSLREQIEENTSKEMESMQLRIKELEIKNDEFRRELEIKNQHVTTNKPFTDNVQKLLNKNQKLEFKNEELKDCLAEAQKNVHLLQLSKEKMTSRHNQRQEEILAELEESRSRNRQLQSQIHYIRTSYHELFPTQLFTIPLPRNNNSKRGNSSERNKKAKPSPFSPRSPKSKSKQVLIAEKLITQSKTWVTGKPQEVSDESTGNDEGSKSGLDDPSES